MVAGVASGAGAQSPPIETRRCSVPSALLDSPYNLPRTRARLSSGQSLTIVALGSSSTEGMGATSPAHTYPSRLQAELRQRFPRSAITVLNRGVSGEETSAMLARFRRDVIDNRPDLLIWQAGTNSALRDGDVARLVDDLQRGITMAHAAGIDVMLMEPQNAPRVTAKPHWRDFVRHLHLVSQIERAPLVLRFEVMSHWLESGQFTMAEMIAPDGLHLTDASYYCLGRIVAAMITRQAPADIATLR
ncbi:MAG: SGNH/GDSL hydrolase family protein [Alphaproteobacteria bacterium]|nr:SGNH/GDSL hydrolase family protein [Alphaproteobacteria bacterium]